MLDYDATFFTSSLHYFAWAAAMDILLLMSGVVYGRELELLESVTREIILTYLLRERYKRFQANTEKSILKIPFSTAHKGTPKSQHPAHSTHTYTHRFHYVKSRRS